MAPHSRTLAWKIPWMEEPGRLQSMGLLRVGHDWATSLSLFTFMHWRKNGNPLQCSCLENPRGRRAWWADVCGVTQSPTRLKWLSSSSSKSHQRDLDCFLPQLKDSQLCLTDLSFNLSRSPFSWKVFWPRQELRHQGWSQPECCVPLSLSSCLPLPQEAKPHNSPSRAGFPFWPHLNMLEAITALWVSTWNFTYNLSQPKSLFLIKHFPLCLTFLNTLVHFRVLVIQLVLEKKKWELAMCTHFFLILKLCFNIQF